MLNSIEDEKETNNKIRDLVDIAVRMFVGSPKKEGEEEVPQISQEVTVGQEPNQAKPDVNYIVQGARGEQIGIRKIMSTEFDKILNSGGKYKGFGVEEVKKEKKEK